MRIHLIGVFVVLFFTAGQAVATDCSREQSNSAMKQCYSQSYENENKKLKAVSENFISKCEASKDTSRSSVIIGRFKGSQNAWLKFRDENCIYESATMLNGTGEGLVWLVCLNSMTRSRILDLKKIEDEMLSSCG